MLLLRGYAQRIHCDQELNDLATTRAQLRGGARHIDTPAAMMIAMLAKPSRN